MIVRTTTEELRLLARLMRAEAESEGKLGMMLVGNVGVNRVISSCLDFRHIRTIRQMIFQRPGGFEATMKGYFYQRARAREIRLARQVVDGQRYHPATYSLWYFRPAGECPAEWYNQRRSGRYKAHCFFVPDASDCPAVYSTPHVKG